MDINLKSRFDIGEKVYFLNSGIIDYGFIKEITLKYEVDQRKRIVFGFYYRLYDDILKNSEKILEERKIYKAIEDLVNDLIENSTDNRKQKRTRYGQTFTQIG